MTWTTASIAKWRRPVRFVAVLSLLGSMCLSPSIARAANAIASVRVTVASTGPGRPHWLQYADPESDPFSFLRPAYGAFWAATVTVDATADAPCAHWSFAFRSADGDFLPGDADGIVPGESDTNRAESQLTAPYEDGPNNPQAEVGVVAQCTSGAAVIYANSPATYVDQPPIPGTAPLPGHIFTQGAKEDFYTAAASGIIAGAVLLGIAATLATGGAAAGFAISGVAALAAGLGAGGLALYDPPDSHYQQIASIADVVLPHDDLPCPSRLKGPRCRDWKAAFSNVMSAESSTVTVLRAMSVTNNRWHTALSAGDVDSALLQVGVGNLYAPMLAQALTRQYAAQQHWAVVLRRDHQDVRISGQTQIRTLRAVENSKLDRPYLQELSRLLRPLGGLDGAKAVIADLEHARRLHPGTTRLSTALGRSGPTADLTAAPSTIGPAEAAEINEALIRQGDVGGNLVNIREDFVQWRLACDPSVRESALAQAQSDSTTVTGPNAALLRQAIAEAVVNPDAGLQGGCPT